MMESPNKDFEILVWGGCYLQPSKGNGHEQQYQNHPLDCQNLIILVGVFHHRKCPRNVHNTSALLYNLPNLAFHDHSKYIFCTEREAYQGTGLATQLRLQDSRHNSSMRAHYKGANMTPE